MIACSVRIAVFAAALCIALPSVAAELASMRKVRDQPLDDVPSRVAAMSEAEKDDVRVFSASRAATVLHKNFPDVDIAPEAKAALLARIQQTCGVTLSNL